MSDIRKSFLEFNSFAKENDSIYQEAIKKLGVSDSVFWMLYTLRESGEALTQSEIVNTVYMPPQTINSALKKLEREGFVELKSEGDRRSKRVYLTKSGETLTKSTADKVMLAEQRALAGLDAEELEELLRLYRKYLDVLKENFSELSK